MSGRSRPQRLRRRYALAVLVSAFCSVRICSQLGVEALARCDPCLFARLQVATQLRLRLEQLLQLLFRLLAVDVGRRERRFDLCAPSLQLCDAGLAACYFRSQRAEAIAALGFEALALLLLLIRLLTRLLWADFAAVSSACVGAADVMNQRA